MSARLGDKNPITVGVVSLVVIVIIVALAVNAGSLAFWRSSHHYAAYLTNASGLTSGDTVQIRGVRVGQVDDISVHGNRVLVEFTVNGHRLGEDTTAAVKVLNPLGTEFLGIDPAGPGELSAPIPTSHTSAAMTLLGDLGEVSRRVQRLDLKQLQKALDVGTTNLSATSAKAVKRALSGLAKFSATLSDKAGDLDRIVTRGSSLAKILNSRKDQLVNLISQGDVLLGVLQTRRKDITALLSGTSDLSREVAAILKVNEKELNPMLRDLQHISEILAKEDHNISAAIPAMKRLSEDLASVTGNGPFLDVVVPTGLLPDSLIHQCSGSAYPAPKNPVVGCRP